MPNSLGRKPQRQRGGGGMNTEVRIVDNYPGGDERNLHRLDGPPGRKDSHLQIPTTGGPVLENHQLDVAWRGAVHLRAPQSAREIGVYDACTSEAEGGRGGG